MESHFPTSYNCNLYNSIILLTIAWSTNTSGHNGKNLCQCVANTDRGWALQMSDYTHLLDRHFLKFRSLSDPLQLFFLALIPYKNNKMIKKPMLLVDSGHYSKQVRPVLLSRMTGSVDHPFAWGGVIRGSLVLAPDQTIVRALQICGYPRIIFADRMRTHIF